MTAEKAIKIGGLLLAAGGSSRLGRPKQLIVFRQKTLLRRAAETLVNSECEPIVIVLGAETERSLPELSGLDVTICINDEWQTGMSSSIRAGLQNLLEIEPHLAAVVITLCDQPHVTSNMIDLFVAAFNQTHVPIIAAQYLKIIGVPALFSNELFNDLLSLKGDKGARDMIRNGKNISKIPMEGAALDIDTPNDLMGLERLRI